jgi:putative FmdB family regulatory protein
MPIYEYVCKKCCQPFEALVRGSEKPKCPHCGSTQLAKQLSVPSAHSQGSSSLLSAPCGRPAPS